MEKRRKRKFKIFLDRSYSVEVSASNIEKAKQIAEFFIGKPQDDSTVLDKKKFDFSFGRMELLYNEARES